MADDRAGRSAAPTTRRQRRRRGGRCTATPSANWRRAKSRVIHLSALTDKPEGNFASCVSVAYNPTLCSTAMIVSPQIKLTLAAPEQIDLCAKDGALTVHADQQRHGRRDGHQGVASASRWPADRRRPQAQSPSTSRRWRKARANRSASSSPRRRSALSRTRRSRRRPGGDVKSDEVVTKVIAPKLTVAVKAPEKDYAGTAIPYEITVKNTGDAPARDAFVSLDTAAARGSEFLGFGPRRARLKARLSSPPAAGRWIHRLRDTRQSLGTLEPGQSRTIHANLRSSRGRRTCRSAPSPRPPAPIASPPRQRPTSRPCPPC